jgi:hypothetical protein
MKGEINITSNRNSSAELKKVFMELMARSVTAFSVRELAWDGDGDGDRD